MTVRLGEWDSPGAFKRRDRFEQDRKRALDAATPAVTSEAFNAFRVADRGLARSPVFNLGMPQLQPTPVVQLGASFMPTMAQPGQINPPATIAPPGAAGPFPFQGGRGPLELLGGAASFIGGLPLPGGPVTATPGIRPTISVPRAQPVSQVLETERAIFQPVTRPVGEFAGRTAVEAIVPGTPPALRLLGVPEITPGRERAREVAGAVGEAVAGEVLLPTNLIPIPIVDPALARLLGITAKMAKGVTPGVLEALSRNADTIARAGGKFATEARKFVDDAANLLPSERGAAQLGPGAFEPEPIRPPAGQEAPLFPGLEERAALAANVEAAARRPLGPAEQVPADITGAILGRRRTSRFADLNLPPGRIPEDTATAERFFALQKERMAAGIEPSFNDTPEFSQYGTIGGRDFAGEELTRKSLPTTTDVQNWSQRIPPEERAAMAGDVADIRRPIEDFDAVAARNADRYKSNWFTKLDDWLQPRLGRNRELQTKVRNIFVDRDSYVHQQGSRMRLAAREWIGRHRESLGLVTGELDPLVGRLVGQQRRGYALKVVVREGAEIPTKARQHLNHIIEHPEKYNITPEQRAALDEYEAIFDNLVRAEQRHGVDVNELWEAYAPRLITKAPKGMEYEAAIKQMRTRFPSTHPWYTKSRAMPDVEQLFAAGYELGDPLAAMEMRLAAGAETIANQRSVRSLQALGDIPSELVPQTVRQRLRDATDAHKIARAQALKTGSTADRAVAEQAAVALDEAKREMRKAATLARERRPVVRGRTVKPDVALEVQKFLQDQGEGVVDDIFRVMRTSLINADYGSLMLQNWTTFWRNNPAWLKAAGLGARSISDAPYDYIVRNADAIDIGLRYGAIMQPEEFLLRRGGKPSQLLGKAPIVRESQNIFEWNVFVAQTERWKGVMRLARNEEEFLDLASVLRKQSGSNFMPGLTRKQSVAMSRLFFAPQFTTALTSAVLDPLRPGLSGVARREAIKTMSMLFGGTAAMTVAINMRFDGSPGNLTDPNKTGFWGIRVGKGFFYPFGPFQPLVVVLARSGRAANDVAHGRTPSKRDLQAGPRFLTNKGSMPVRWVLRVAEAMGVSPEGLIGPSFGRPEVVREGEAPLTGLRRELGELAPIGPSQAIEGIRAGAPITALEVAGGRTTVVSVFAKRDEVRQEIMQQRGLTGNFDDLDDIRQAEIDQDPRIQALKAEVAKLPARDRIGEGFDVAEELRVAQLAEQEADDDALDAGTMPGDRWVRNHSDRERRLFDQREAVFEAFGISFDDEEAKGRVNQAIDAYFAVDLDADFTDPQSGEADYFGFRQAQKAALEPLTDAERQKFDDLILGKHDTEMEKRFRTASRLLDDAPVPLKHLNAAQYEELSDFYREITRFRDYALETRGRSLGVEEAIRLLGAQLGKSESFIEFAVLARPGSSSRESLRNRDYDLYLLRNHHDEGELGLFFPNLYRRDVLQRALFELSR